MKKILYILGICTLGYYGWGMFAIDNDCWLVNNLQDIQTSNAYQDMLNKPKQQNFTSALPAEALEKALNHLKNFCCQSSSISNNNCGGYKQAQWYPPSPYLYDHLIDISIRRLDALPEFAYGLAGDPTGVKRRSFISQAATGALSPQSQGIAQEYTAYRQTKKPINDKSSPLQIKIFLDKYNTSEVSLIDKYNAICKIMKEAYNSITSQKVLIDDKAYTTCQTMINERINKEYEYTKTIMIKTSNETLDQTYKKYTMKYFIQEKVIGLMDLINQIKSLFSTMVHQAAAAKSCSK